MGHALAVVVGSALLGWGAPVGAVTFLEQGERLQQVYAHLLDFRPAQAPLSGQGGRWEVGLDFIPVPAIDNRIGVTDKPVDPPAAIPRPRLRVFRPSGFGWGITLTPPLEVGGYTATLAGAEAFFHFPAGPLRVGLRAYVLTGQVEGPVTAPETADRFSLTTRGTDLLVGLAREGWMPYLGIGQGSATTVLRVAADGARLGSEATLPHQLIGATWAGDALAFTVEQSRTGDFLSHFVVALSLFF